MKKTGLTDAWKVPTLDMEKRLAAVKKAYKMAKKDNVVDWRKAHLTNQLRDAKKKLKRSPKAQERYLLLWRMKQREETRRRRKARGKGFQGGLKAIQVLVPSEQGTGTRLATITDRHLVEQGCRDEGRARYDQTRAPYATPPMEEPLYSMFNGPSAAPNSIDLLTGLLPLPPDLDRYSRTFLTQCRFHKEFHFMSMVLSTSDHIGFWRKMNENKGSEPHGLHNGHFKAGSRAPLLAYCDTVFRRLPLLSGMIPDLWKHLTNFVIEKEPGNWLLKKMRIIQMMNAEFQANNKMIGRLGMKNAEKHNLIPPGQCGSRKKHQSIDLALSKRLVWDLLITQRRAAGWISNDAKSCFDRIVHSVAKISLLRFGIPWQTLEMMFKTLSNATHWVRTGYGEAKDGFFPPSDKSFQGCGQGNSAGPPIWVAVSAILILMMEAAGFGFESLNVIDLEMLTAQCFSFVDDTEAIEAARDIWQTGKDIFERIQEAAKLWSGGIRTTGGAINPEKSFWWLIDFIWNPTNGTWTCRRISTDDNFKLQIFGLDGNLQTLERLEPTQSKRNLGVMLAPVEDEQAHFDFVRKKAKSWAEQVRGGYLKRYDVIPLIKTTILKTLEYPSALTTLSYDRWSAIMSPVLQVCLPKAGICRSFTQDFIYAPLKFQGLGIPHPFVTQMYHHLDMLLRHPSNRTQTSRYLEGALQAHQLETGTSFGLLQQAYDNTAILVSDTWLKRVWRILEAYDVYVAFDSPVPRLRTTNDRLLLLMEVLIEAEVDQELLKWMNWCRLYLGVVTISDMVTADGRSIRQSILDGVRDGQVYTDYQWPRLVAPTSFRWKMWREQLSAILLEGNTLREPLGVWTDDIESWRWVYSPSVNRLFHRHNHVWVQYKPNQDHPTGRNFFPDDEARIVSSLPPDLIRASVARRSVDVRAVVSERSIRLTGTGQQHMDWADVSLPKSIHTTWNRAAEQVSSHYGWVPEKVFVTGSEQRLAEDLRRNEVYIVSDGSYKRGLGTAAIIITTLADTDRITLVCRTPGVQDSQSAYRSELIGILSAIMAVDWMCSSWGVLPVTVLIQFACDGKSALGNAFGDRHLLPSMKQFDLLSAIRGALRQTKVRWLPQHVDGHRDDSVSWEELTWWEQRNVEADQLAKAYRRQLEEQANLPPALNARFFTESSALFINGIKQQALSKVRLMELVALPRLRKRWSDRQTITRNVEEEVDWATVAKAMKGLRPGLQRWITKHSEGMCGVGRWLRRWKWSTHDKCPICGVPDETAHHVPRCPDTRAAKAWAEQIDVLAAWLSSHKTDPELSRIILHFLDRIRSPTARVIHVSQPYRAVLDSQLIIGPQGLLEGRLSRLFRPLQDQFYHRTGNYLSGSCSYSGTVPT